MTRWLLALAICASGCDPVVTTLPPDRAERVIRALGQARISARTHRAGGQLAISVPASARSHAQAVIRAVDRPALAPARPRLVRGPTEARLDAADANRRRLELAIAALPSVLAVQVATVDGARLAVVTTAAEPGDTERRVRALLGPGARVEILPLPVPANAIAASPRRPSVVLSAAVVLLSLMILGLLVHIRRLRRSLGR